MNSDLKATIIDKLQKEFVDINITDTPISIEKQTKESNLPKILFKKYECIEKNIISVIDFSKYNDYGVEEVPLIDIDIVGYFICFKSKKYKIVDYDNENGIIELNSPIKNLYEFNDILYISGNDDECNVDVKKDFIFVYSIYNYSNTLNAKIVENYNRFSIDVFIYEDISNNKIKEYSDRIRRLFNRDFTLKDKNNNITKDTAYIYGQITFNVTEYNVSNKIMRGSMLIKTYEKE